MNDLTKIEKPFGLLDAETKAALNAHGGPYEWVTSGGWVEIECQGWIPAMTYRVKPQSVRGEVVLTGMYENGEWSFGAVVLREDTHRITLPTIGSKLILGAYTGPDGSTITIETLK